MKHEDRAEKEGYQAGYEWAKDYAKYEELNGLSKYEVAGQPMAPYSHSDYAAFKACGVLDGEEDASVSVEFWEQALGNEASRVQDDEEFLIGFIDGASDLFNEVAEAV